MEKDMIQQLEQQVDGLLDASRRSRKENMLLQSQKVAWLSDRAQLLKKTEIARARIDKMVQRLKEMDGEL